MNREYKCFSISRTCTHTHTQTPHAPSHIDTTGRRSGGESAAKWEFTKECKSRVLFKASNVTVRANGTAACKTYSISVTFCDCRIKLISVSKVATKFETVFRNSDEFPVFFSVRSKSVKWWKKRNTTQEIITGNSTNFVRDV